WPKTASAATPTSANAAASVHRTTCRWWANSTRNRDQSAGSSLFAHARGRAVHHAAGHKHRYPHQQHDDGHHDVDLGQVLTEAYGAENPQRQRVLGAGGEHGDGDFV